jgi:hypothetical protein
LWDVWQVAQLSPPECSATTTVGYHAGLPVRAAWQPMQRLAISGSFGFTVSGASACAASGPWQLSHATAACLAAARISTMSAWQSAHAVCPACTTDPRHLVVHGAGAVVAVDAEVGRDEDRPCDQEHDDAGEEKTGEPEQVLDVAELH